MKTNITRYIYSSILVSSLLMVALFSSGCPVEAIPQNALTLGNGGIGSSAFTFTPSSYGFGSLTAGTSLNKTVTIKNTSGLPLLISNISGLTSPITLASDTCPRTPSYMLADTTCDATVTFAPTQGGSWAQSLVITYTAPSTGSLTSSWGVSGSSSSPIMYVDLSDRVFRSTYHDQATALVADWGDIETGSPSDTGMTYACVFQKNATTPFAGVTPCTSLPADTAASFNTATGVLTWTPNITASGIYQIQVTGTNAGGASAKVLTVDVRETYSLTNLFLNLDANFSALTQPTTATSTISTWYDLTSGGFNATGTALIASGTGTATDPYRVVFDGATSTAALGSSAMLGKTQMYASAWIMPASVTTAGSTLLTSGGLSGNGFVVKQAQSTLATGSYSVSSMLEGHVGNTGNYRTLILNQGPISYWRLNESSGNPVDEMGVQNMSVAGTITYGVSGAIAGSSATGIRLPQSNDNIVYNSNVSAWNTMHNTGRFSVSLWARRPASGTCCAQYLVGNYLSGVSGGWLIYMSNSSTDTIDLFFNGSGASSAATKAGGLPADNAWHHIVGTGDGTTLTLYIDGVSQATAAQSTVTAGNAGVGVVIGRYGGANVNYYYGDIQEVAVFGYPLSAGEVRAQYNAGKYMHYPINAIEELGPRAWFRFNELSGTTMTDYSGYGNDGTYTGNYLLGQNGAWSSGDSDKAVRFDGTTGYATAGAVSTYNFAHNTGKFSVSLWLKRDALEAAANKYALGNYVNSASGCFEIYYVGSSTDIYGYFAGGGAGAQVTANNSFPGDSVWRHYVFTGDASNLRMYVNGVLTGGPTAQSAITAGDAAAALYFARYASGGQMPALYMDEVAIFDYTLTASQISTLYNSGKSRFCRTSALTNNLWYHMGFNYDGSIAQLFLNGRKECEATPPTGASFTASTTLTSGSTASGTGFWAGVLETLRLYAVGFTAATAYSSVAPDAASTVIRHMNVTPASTPVTSGLVLNLDAANYANTSTGFKYNGAACPTSWFDLSMNGNSGARFLNWAGCADGTFGWSGAGTTGSPYRLTFDGAGHSAVVVVNDSPSLESHVGTTGVATWEVWVKFTSLATSPVLFAKWDNSAAYTGDGEYIHYIGATGTIYGALYDAGATQGDWHTSTSPISTGTWYQIVIVWDGSQGVVADRTKFYVNGAQVATTQGGGPTAPTIVDSTSNLTIGAYQNGINHTSHANFLNGDLALARIYNRALTQTEIRTNCAAFAGRFSVTCL